MGKSMLPPSSRSSRFVQAIELYRRPLEFLERSARDYGSCFSIRPPGFPAPVTVVSDPDAIKEIFAADGAGLTESGSIAAPMMEPLLGEHSMLILDGAKHRRHRGLVMPFFARAQFAKFGKDILRLIDREIGNWPTAARFPIRPKMQNITLQVILRVIFGDRADSVLDATLVRRFFGRGPSPLIFMHWMQIDLGPLSPWGQFLRLRSEIYRSIRAEVESRRSDPGIAKGDIVAAFLDARDETGCGLEEQEILDEILTLILAGNDTTATALSWAVFHIFSNQEVLGKLRRELTNLCDADESNANRIVELPYLDATVKEVLRISPIFAIALRRLTQTMPLAGYELPAGTLVAPCIYLVHRQADLWDEPERFKPERFLDARHPSNHFFPFGGGIRHCIGAALATYEMKLVLARVVACTELRLDDNYIPRARWIGNFLGPSKNVPVVCSERVVVPEERAAS